MEAPPGAEVLERVVEMLLPPLLQLAPSAIQVSPENPTTVKIILICHRKMKDDRMNTLHASLQVLCFDKSQHNSPKNDHPSQRQEQASHEFPFHLHLHADQQFKLHQLHLHHLGPTALQHRCHLHEPEASKVLHLHQAKKKKKIPWPAVDMQHL